MGTYLNPGIKSYQIAVNSEIYVDKNEMITMERLGTFVPWGKILS